MTGTADNGMPEAHAFGRWRFDANTGELFDGATTTRLEPQVAKLLDYLLRHQNTLISRDELMAAVWENRVVSDDAINRCISILRQTLTPDDKNAFIETVVRRGFVSHFPPPPAEPAPTAQRPRRRNYRVLAALAGVAAIIAYGAFSLFPASPPQAPDPQRVGIPVVAVLPFVSAGSDDDSTFFANGMHDDLLTQLAQLQSLRVISRTSVLGYRDSNRNIREIGRELGADAILEGGVQRVGDQIRINVQLIDAHADGHLWARQYDRELSPVNIFEVQTEIAQAIASALHSALTEQEAAQLKILPTENMAAYRAYHQAMKLRNTETIGAPAYIAALENAVTLDPEFVRAWAELAGSLSYVNLNRQDPDSVLRLEGILERIQLLAPQSAEYQIAQAYFTYYILKDYPRAYELIRQARDLRPNDTQVLELQSWIQRRLGNFEGMIESRRLARTLDPRNPYWTINLVSVLIMTHRYEEAIEESESFPVDNFELSVLRALLQLRNHQDPGRRLEALATLQREYGKEVIPVDLWEAHIAARDYAGAAQLLDSIEAADSTADDWGALLIPGIELARIITYGFLDKPDRAAPFLVEARAKLESETQPGPVYWGAIRYLALAFVTAAEGNADESERLVRAWQREAARDLAELAVKRHHACRALGLAVAASAAVECIRSGLAEPSLVMPFVEPFLPYYDSIRNEPAFVDLVTEIQAPTRSLY
ncbi:MAG: winged helix-turn-helix domain-containing protein [Lysobacterales bacterium]